MTTSATSTGQGERILIVLLGAIGDVCRALPLAVRIKRAWPDCVLHWAVEPKSQDLLLEHPAVDRLIIFDRPRGLPAFLRLLREVRAGKYSIVIDLQRHLKSGLVTAATCAKRRIGYHRKNAKEFNWLFSTEQICPLDNFSPKIFQYQRFGDHLGLPKLDPLIFNLQPTQTALEHARSLLGTAQPTPAQNSESRQLVGVVMGSSWQSRFWPEEHYSKLIREIAERFSLRSVLIGGAGERLFTDTVIAASDPAHIIDTVGKGSLADCVALLTRVRVAIAPDCGPGHIAAAVGVPVVTLFGATDLQRSVPYGSERFGLQSTIGCSPCYRRVCPGLNTLCMREIPVEAVLAQLARVLAPTVSAAAAHAVVD